MTNQPGHPASLRTWFIAGASIAALALGSSAHHIGLPVIAATTSNDPDVLPSGYRDWTLISVAALGTPFNDLRAKLGNVLAIRTFRERKHPFPDGAMIARLAWKQVQSEVNNNAFRQDPSAEHFTPATLEKFLATSFAAGHPTNVQLMIKDSKKYAATAGWGFFQFSDGKPDHIVQSRCLACHASVSATDFVFTRYSP
jgi:hypothetical protein